ncbi:putative membrane protein (TIGR02234 family) [Nocardioides thalensis]|uniref:Putative membrane protein (TIGR02234 family) n=1 Tax=Nocardioides thalensis TaxID=1914755 RepID=A0A853BYI3_9ACTN|nr:putative membrane protein (TIGR02234 family) [Nocardioides thalensis]
MPDAATPTPDTDPRRRTFAPVVLVGLAASVLTAIAGHRAMLRIPESALEDIGMASYGGTDAAASEFPLAGALGLVALACWGVLLVTRGRLRRLVAVLATLSAAGVVAVAVVGGFLQADDYISDATRQLGYIGLSGDLGAVRTGWFWAALFGSAVATAAGAAAVRLAPAWPEMGSRYDAPAAGGAATATVAPAEELSSTELWKSLDEGDDPTA